MTETKLETLIELNFFQEKERTEETGWQII